MLDTIAQRLREVTVRPTVGGGERRRWDALMGAHHYLPFRGLVGRSVRHVAVLGEHWLALIGWHAGAFKLQARDRWIGWLPEQQFRRLHLIANNARFVILPGCGAANLASRVLGLSVRRVRQRIDPAPASCPSGLLQPAPGALHRAHRDRVLQGPRRAGPRCSGPRRTHLGRAAQPRRRAPRPSRQAPPRAG